MATKTRDATKDRETLRKFVKNMGRAVGFCPDDGKGKVADAKCEEQVHFIVGRLSMMVRKS